MGHVTLFAERSIRQQTGYRSFVTLPTGHERSNFSTSELMEFSILDGGRSNVWVEYRLTYLNHLSGPCFVCYCFDRRFNVTRDLELVDALGLFS